MMNKSRLKNNLLLIIALGLFFYGGLYVGYNKRPWIDRIVGIDHKESEVTTTADFEPFWKVWTLINEKNPDASKIADQDRVWGAISGLVSSLNDPYSEFFPPAESKDFNETIAGEFSGVGMEVGMKDKILTVIAPLKGTPAEKAGIKSGDKILKIDKQITSDMSVDEAIKLIRGKEGTTVTLTVYRDGEKEPREFTITRGIINIPTIDGKMRDDGIYVISLYNFSANSAELFKEEIMKFKASGSKKLILDLRGNPGGYLDSAVDIASFFLPSGKVVVTEDYGIKGKEDISRSKGFNLFDDTLQMVVLIDGGSASASEILAGALHEQGIATLVGEQSYGKGSVQELLPVTADTSVKITIAKWLTPDGNSISEKGLTPDYVVPLTQADSDAKRDPQLDKAISILKQKK